MSIMRHDIMRPTKSPDLLGRDAVIAILPQIDKTVRVDSGKSLLATYTSAIDVNEICCSQCLTKCDLHVAAHRLPVGF